MKSAAPNSPLFLIGLFFLSMPLFGGEFHGLVLDEYQDPLQGIPLYMVYPEGRYFKTITGSDGTFFFGDLPVGQATCYLDLPDDFQAIYPVCGEMRVSVSHPKGAAGKAQASGPVFVIEKIPQAIIINYGKPKPPGSSGKPKVIFPGNWPQSAQGSLHHDRAAHGGQATFIETIGRWSLPFQPGVRLIMKDPVLAPTIPSSKLQIDLTTLNNGRVRIRIRALLGSTIPDGLLGSYTLTADPDVPVFPGPIHFCEESTTIFEGNILLFQGHHYLWQGQTARDNEFQNKHQTTLHRK